MALGRAFIEVHADTAPFARELATELERIVGSTEVQQKVRTSARKTGEQVSDGVGEGIRRNRSKVSDNLENAVTDALGGGAITRLAKGIVDTIDDGLSGLPAEFKAILGAALVAATPVALALGAGIAQAIGAGLLLFGGAGLAVLIGAQFEEISQLARDTFSDLRSNFLEAASAFTGSFYVAINAVRDRFTELQPELVIIFAKISRTLEPLVDALFDGIGAALPGISSAFDDIGRFIAPLRVGLALIGDSIGHFFETIAAHGDSDEIFLDLLYSISFLIDLLTTATQWGLNLYGAVLDIGQALGVFADGEKAMQSFGDETSRTTAGATTLNGVIQNTVSQLDSEVKSVEELNRELTQLGQLLLAGEQNQINFERALDSLTESVDENGRSLNIQKEAGRQNAEALLQLAQIALRTRDDTLALTGSSEQAQAAFLAQRSEIYRLAESLGLGRQRVDEIIGQLLKIPPPKSTGVTGAALTRLEEFNRELQETIYLQSLFDPTFNPRGPGGTQKYADGGIVSRPTLGLVGEAGPEAIIPLSNPARAAEVMNEAGLSGMLGSPVVNVYIGNEQIRDYIVAETNQQLTAAARAMTYGTRGI